MLNTPLRWWAFLICSSIATAQCDLSWASAGSFPGADDIVYASTVWDPDGPGPEPEIAVVGGQFTAVGRVLAQHVASYNATTGQCAAIGNGLPGTVHALLPLPSGELIAGGSFPGGVATWNGTAWSSLGAGLNGTVRGLAMENGQVIAIGSMALGAVARFDGVSWSSLGFPGVGNVEEVFVDASGALHVGGDYQVPGNSAADFATVLSGGTWSALGNGPGAPVSSFAQTPAGDIVATGATAFAVKRWDGTSWADMSNGLPGFAAGGQTLHVSASGQLYFACTGLGSVYEWLDALSFWSSIASVTGGATGPNGSDSTIHCLLTLRSGGLLLGGEFRRAQGIGFPNLVVRTTASYQPVGNGLTGRVRSISESPTGAITVCADVQPSGHRLRQWTGTNWDSTCSIGGTPQVVLDTSASARLLAGQFSQTVPWFGGTWTTHHPLGRCGSTYPISGAPGESGTALVELQDSSVLLGTSWGNVAQMHADGSNPTALGTVHGSITAFAELPTGELFAATAGNSPTQDNLVTWSANSWQGVGGGLNGDVHALAVTPTAGLVVGGSFTMAGALTANGIARWQGGAWSTIGSGFDGPVLALLALPNGDLIAGGTFTTAGGQPAANVARWDGSNWSEVAGGTNGTVRDILLAKDGTIWIGGNFSAAGPVSTGYIAKLETPCPATATAFGQGCSGSNGVNVLTTTSLPWLGSTSTTLAEGMPALAFCISAYGYAPSSIPLQQIFPQAGIGCLLLTAPIILDLQLASQGTATFSLNLPSTQALASQVLWQQVIAIEVDGGANFTDVTSTNALELRIGSL